jgi:high-affinity nickel-transport protein
MFAVLLGGNAVVWILAVLVFAPTHGLLVGTALLAYTFGLRHAVDADHISAIDNVTRKLMQEGKKPVAVGFFFSLGHSTIVVALTLAIVLGAAGVTEHLPALEGLGGVVGTSISAGFLFVIAAINALVLVEIVRTARRVRAGEPFCDRTLNESLDQRGLLGRVFKPLLRLVSRSRDMYFIGVLFGLGFDTATEIGLLGIAAIEAGKGLPIWAILILPALFAAGMSLIDTTDGILMLGAYGWAFIKPIRKLYYNLTITLVSVLVAVLIGGIEALGLVADQMKLEGPFWRWIGALNDNFGSLGYLIIAIFVGSWIVSIAVYRLGRFDLLEVAPS